MKKIYLLSLIVLFALTKTDAQVWTSLGTNALGTSSLNVKALAVSPVDGSIYAGGTFNGTINYIAKRNSASGVWEAIGSSVNGPVYALTFYNNELYVGGVFTTAGGNAAKNIAKLSSSGTWSAVGNGVDDQVNCLFVSTNNTLYAGGKFNNNGTATAALAHIAKWNGSDWAAVGNGLSSSIIRTIAEYNSTIYVGTENTATPIYSFNGSSFSAVTSVTGGKVYALATYGNYLYAGGDFSQPTFAATRFNGSTWGTISTTFLASEHISSLYVRAGVLYIGGVFTNKGVTNNANYIAKVLLQGSNPTPLQTILSGNSLGGDVFAINNSNGKVLAGGNFTTWNNAAITSTTIGVDEITNVVSDLKFYPNPVQSSATLDISFNEFVGSTSISFYDMQSRLITLPVETQNDGTHSRFSIDCSTLPEGNYFYMVSSEGKAVANGMFVK